MTAHAKRSPSSAHRWMNCPGSAEAEAQYSDTSNEYAAWGTYAHEVSEDCLSLGFDAADFIGQTKVVDGFEFTVDAEMADCCQVYLDEVRSDEDEGEGWAERRLVVNDECWGTGDHVRRGPTWIKVRDLKTGFNIVEPTSPQLKIYALGALLDSEINTHGGPFDVQQVHAEIVQPRAIHPDGPVRSETWTPHQLITWQVEELLPAVAATYGLDAPFVAGDWCKYCKHQAGCPVFNAQSQCTDDTIASMSAEELGDELDQIPLYKERIKALEAEGAKRVNLGHPPIGKDGPYKVVMGTKHKIWGPAAEDKIKAKIGDKAYTQSLKSPAQIAKLAGGKELAAKYAFKPQGQPQLASAADKREPMQQKTASEMFAKHMTEPKGT